MILVVLGAEQRPLGLLKLAEDWESVEMFLGREDASGPLYQSSLYWHES